MKTSHRLIKALVFTWIIMLGMLTIPMSVKAASKQNKDYKYTVKNNEVTIEEYTGNKLHVIVPSKIDGYPVTKIEYQAFSQCNVQTIYIPSSVTMFNGTIFSECRNLTSVIIGSGITEIKYPITSDCKKLKYIVLGENVLEVCDHFSGSTEDRKVYISVPNEITAPMMDRYWSEDIIVCEPKSAMAAYAKDISKELIRCADTYVNITFKDGDKVKAIANRIWHNTNINELFSLDDKKGQKDW